MGYFVAKWAVFWEVLARDVRVYWFSGPLAGVAVDAVGSTNCFGKPPAKGESMHLSEPRAAGDRRLIWISVFVVALWLSLVNAGAAFAGDEHSSQGEGSSYDHGSTDWGHKTEGTPPSWEGGSDEGHTPPEGTVPEEPCEEETPPEESPPHESPPHESPPHESPPHESPPHESPPHESPPHE